jgi:glycerol-3-phosphate cytidylyltransferase
MPGNTVGYAFGVFDLLNIEHVDLLHQALAHCDRLVIGVASDDLVRRSGGPAPFTPEDERVEIVSSVRGVARAELLDGPDLATAAGRAGAQVLFGLGAGAVVRRALHPDEKLAVSGIRVLHLVPRRQTASRTLRGALTRPGRSAVA